jgi:hypothetical protein
MLESYRSQHTFDLIYSFWLCLFSLDKNMKKMIISFNYISFRVLLNSENCWIVFRQKMETVQVLIKTEEEGDGEMHHTKCLAEETTCLDPGEPER